MKTDEKRKLHRAARGNIRAGFTVTDEMVVECAPVLCRFIQNGVRQRRRVEAVVIL